MLLAESLLRIDPGLQVALLGVVGVDVVEVGNREAGVHDGVDVNFGLVEELGDVRVVLLLVVAAFLPTLHGRPVPLDHHEVRIQQQDDLIFHLLFVQLHAHRLAGLVAQGV